MQPIAPPTTPPFVRALGKPGLRAQRILEKPRADEGYFGADSVSWRVIGHAAVGLGAIRTSIVEMLHPPSAASLYDHSDYATDPIGRATRSATLIAYIVFGDRQTAERAGARWFTIHEQINGRVRSTGKRYRALDLDNLLWIYMTGWHSFFISNQVYGRPISSDDADRFFAEAAFGAELMGIPGVLIPRTHADVSRYLAEMKPELCLTEEGRQVIDFFIRPPMRPLSIAVANPGLRLISRVAVATLPRDLRKIARIESPRLFDLAVRPPALAITNAISLRQTMQVLAAVAPETWAIIEQARHWGSGPFAGETEAPAAPSDNDAALPGTREVLAAG